MKLDILVIAAHPDDAELGCSGTIASHVAAGKKVGILDLTYGELGTRGSVEIRKQEAADSSTILGLTVRENLGLRDGFFQNAVENQLAIVHTIRKYMPDIILANAVTDRHPDHGKAAQLVFDASFLAGLVRVETSDVTGKKQSAWRPKTIYHYIQSQYIEPDLVVDISAHWDTKMRAIRAFKSQFFDPDSKEPETYISNPGFLKMIESRAIELGHAIGVKYGEGFTVTRFPGVKSLFDLL